MNHNQSNEAVSERSPWIRSTLPLPLVVSRCWSVRMCSASPSCKSCDSRRARKGIDEIALGEFESHNSFLQSTNSPCLGDHTN